MFATLWKKAFAKKAIGKANRNRLVNLIKSVSLKNSETKHTHQIIENVQLYHNVPVSVTTSLLFTDQGISDTASGTQAFSMRIGDEICPRGIALKFWIANKLDRPDVIYRIIVFKYRSGTTVSNTDPYRDWETDRKSTRLNSSHSAKSRMPSSA